jgi:photosystem II stability/assembly factor-like uncharacterized protein
VACLVLLLSSLVACGGGGSSSVEPPPVSPGPVVPVSTTLPERIAIAGPSQPEPGATSTWRVDGLVAAADLSYDWHFGDLGGGSAAEGVFRFDRVGDYELRVSVRNGAGQSVVASTTVRVRRQAMVAGLDCAGGVGQGWCRQAPRPPSTIDATIDDRGQGLAVGEAGLVQVTVDGGRSWQRQPAPTGDDLMSVRLATGGQAWVLTRGGALWRSLDGGGHWQQTGRLPLAREDLVPANGWWALDGQRLIVAGRADAAALVNTVYVSDDAGVTWRASGFASVLGVSPGGTMVGSTSAGLSASRDLGRSVVILVPCPGPSDCLGALRAGLGDDAALTVLGEPPDSLPERRLIRQLSSSDGGSTWTTRDCPLPRYLNSMALFPGKTSYAWTLEPVVDAAGRSTHRWRSGDSGCTWVPSPAADSRFDSVVERAIDADTLLQFQSPQHWQSLDQGRTWRPFAIPGAAGAELVSVQRFSRSGLLIATDQYSRSSTGGWFTSWDDGLAWQPLPGGASASLAGEDPTVGLWFTDARHGVQVSARGQVRVTEDGGLGWALLPPRPGLETTFGWHTSEAIGSLVFTSEKVGWAVDVSSPMRSTDGGANWQPVAAVAWGRMVSMQAIGDSSFWAQFEECIHGGDELSPCERGLYFSDDAGQTPMRRVAGIPPSARVAMADAQAGVMLTADGRLHFSIDGGRSWTPAQSGNLPADSRGSFYFRTPSDVWFLGNVVWHSTDGGRNWITSPLPPATHGLLGIFFVDAQHGWLVGRAGTVLHSADAGRSWTRQDTGTTRDLSRVFAIDADTAWVAGNDAAVLATVTGGR